MIYLSNAFSLSMLDSEDTSDGVCIHFKDVSPEFVRTWLGKYTWTSCVGHEDTAGLLSDLLGISIPSNRVSIKLTPEDVIFVAQYVGPRLPEGTVKLPEGATFKFIKCGIYDIDM